MADIRLKISTQKYQDRITTLQGYVRQLETNKETYQEKMREIPSIWDDAEAEQYYKAIDANIEQVQKAIDAANANIDQLQNIISNLDTTSGNVSSIVTDVTNTAANLFK